MKKIKKIVYENATVYRLHNKRIAVQNIDNNHLLLEFTLATSNPAKRIYETRIKNKLSLTSFTLTKESARYLMCAIAEQLDMELYERKLASEVTPEERERFIKKNLWQE